MPGVVSYHVPARSHRSANGQCNRRMRGKSLASQRRQLVVSARLVDDVSCFDAAGKDAMAPVCKKYRKFGAQLYFTKAACEHMQEGARVVLTSSVSAQLGHFITRYTPRARRRYRPWQELGAGIGTPRYLHQRNRSRRCCDIYGDLRGCAACHPLLRGAALGLPSGDRIRNCIPIERGRVFHNGNYPGGRWRTYIV